MNVERRKKKTRLRFRGWLREGEKIHFLSAMQLVSVCAEDGKGGMESAEW